MVTAATKHDRRGIGCGSVGRRCASVVVFSCQSATKRKNAICICTHDERNPLSRQSRAETGRLNRNRFAWALKTIREFGGNSLFETPFEFQLFHRHAKQLVDDLAQLRVDCFDWSEARQMVIPKDQRSYRLASELDPLDSLILTALVKEIGSAVEAKRLPTSYVFSHRFAASGAVLHDQHHGWREFWSASTESSREPGFVAQTDISDFYGRVPHQEVIDQLERSDVPERLRDAIENFLTAFSRGDGCGLPIGPHAVHLLAEASLVRSDSLLRSRGHRFIRYIDDYQIFCATEEDARIALFDIAEILKQEFGLALNRGKTVIRATSEQIEIARRQTREVDVDAREEEILQVIEDLAGTDNQYQAISLEDAYEVNREAFSEETMGALLEAHLDSGRVDYEHLGWLMRRFTQVGAPGAVPFVLQNFESFAPVVGDAAGYLARAGQHWRGGWKQLGEKVLQHTRDGLVKRSPYLQMILYGLFAQQPSLNHFSALSKRFSRLAQEPKREVLLAARRAGETDWLHSTRRSARNFDPWTRRAFIYACEKLPAGQLEECLKEVDTPEQSTDAILLGALLEGREDPRGLAVREPTGPGWIALEKTVAKARRRFVRGRLTALGGVLEKTVYGPLRQDGLLAATWNLRHLGGAGFGFGQRLPESYVFIARILLGFDVVALQEVRDERSVDRLLSLLGAGWSKVICGEAPGRAGNSEMCAILYRTDRLRFTGHVEQIVLAPRSLVLDEHQFARPPFLAEFAIEDTRLLLCTAHVYFGAKRGRKYERRVGEIRALCREVSARSKKRKSTAVLMGDLNVVDLDDETMRPLTRAGMALDESFLQPTNAAGDKFYSQIALQVTQTGPRLRRAGVVGVFDLVFRPGDLERYEKDMLESRAWETSSRRGPSNREAFFAKWRTYQMSDHLPVWVELRV